MELEDLRLAVYQRFASRGMPPSAAELAESLEALPAEITRGLETLASQRHLVLDASGTIVMAHPFSVLPMGFSVMGRDTLWWGGCAWDAFALVHLLEAEPTLLVATTCPGCSAAQAWNLSRDAAPEGAQVAHFLVPVQRMWDDVVHTCSHQRIFCDRPCVERWLEASGNQLGYTMDLPTLWKLASGWYAGRLSRGYERRDPSAAQDYLRWAGLSGSFWGL